MSVVQLRPKAPFLYGWCGTEFSFQTPRWCGSMAEQLICNQQVVGSTPTTSSKRGKIPEWPKGADCKSVGTAFGGSNPPLPTKKKTSQCGVFFYAGNRGFCAVSPRGALRLNHLFGADAPLMQVNLPVPLLNESTSFKKMRCLFLCEREWMRYRVRKPRFAPPNSNGAVVHLVYHCTTQCSVLLYI